VSARLTVAKLGSSKSQALHQDAKKFTTVGRPRSWVRATVPPSFSAGKTQLAGLVEMPGAWAERVRCDWA
jgi:hypothetical protein